MPYVGIERSGSALPVNPFLSTTSLIEPASALTSNTPRRIPNPTMSSLVRTVQHVAGSVATKAQSTTDAVFPPKRRAELYDQMRGFAVQNPKLAVRPVQLGHRIS